MKKRICIIGSGTAGLNLAYALRENFEVTILHHRSAEDIKNGRIMSTQIQPKKTIRNYFDLEKWNDQTLIQNLHMNIGNENLFVANFKESALSVDQRFYFFHEMKALSKQDVSFDLNKVSNKEIKEIINDFDLVIDCSGKQGPIFPFPIEEDLSPFDKPQRKCIVGYFLGVERKKPIGVNVTILPELGQIIEIPAITEYGPVTIFYISVIPKSRLDVFKGIKNADEFTNKMKEVVQEFFPEIQSRMDEKEFRLCDEKGFLQIAFTPVIRKPYLTIKDKLVIGCGDSVSLNDPITGQGCNVIAYCVEQLAQTLNEHKESQWDERIGEVYWDKINQFVKEVSEWTNAMMQPLPEHVIQLLMAGSTNPEVADQIAEWFVNPRTAYEAFFSVKAL